MKTIYIASGVNHEQDIFMQENAYTSYDLALERAKLMCEDVNANTGMGISPEVTEMSLYEDGDTITTNTITSD